MNKQIPLLVDLDGSLILTDMLHETAVLFIKDKPWQLLSLLLWLLKGKHVLKQKLAEATRLDVASLPVNLEVLEFLKLQKSNGRKLILCTATYQSLADEFARVYPIFDSVMATDINTNLGGKLKLAEAEKRFGKHNFDYLGNHSIDLFLWGSARRALVVGDKTLQRKAAEISELEQSFEVQPPRLKNYLKAMRVHQWAKNSLLFVPLIMAHQMTNPGASIAVLIAFFAFGLCASSTYLFNDLLDLEADRNHVSKCKRPLAAGLISIPNGIVLSILLMLAGLSLALFLPVYFLGVLSVYLVLTILYSFKLKRFQTVDVIVLASLFTIRIVAGAAAIPVDVSFWLLNFSMFIFLSLAVVKRVSELINTAESLNQNQNHKEQTSKIKGRGYYIDDINILQSLGVCAGFMAVLVMAFYINSDEVVQLYSQPQVLWLICPVLGYWIMRIWIMASRGEINEDPISFALGDRKSWYAGLIVLILLVLAGAL